MAIASILPICLALLYLFLKTCALLVFLYSACVSPFYTNRHWCSGNGKSEAIHEDKQQQTNETRTKRSMTTLLSITSLLFLSISARSCVSHRELKMVFGRQTTSFHRASVISCGISGLDVPPQISQPSREACRSRQAAFPIIVLNC